MKKTILIALGVLILAGGILLILRGSEDTWILDKKGVWVKHGNPKNTPNEVSEQQELIKKASELYQEAKESKIDLTNGPCLGLIGSDWVVDIAHSPRQEVDNLTENQCAEYREGKASHFIELDSNGEIIQIK